MRERRKGNRERERERETERDRGREEQNRDLINGKMVSHFHPVSLLTYENFLVNRRGSLFI